MGFQAHLEALGVAVPPEPPVQVLEPAAVCLRDPVNFHLQALLLAMEVVLQGGPGVVADKQVITRPNGAVAFATASPQFGVSAVDPEDE